MIFATVVKPDNSVSFTAVSIGMLESFVNSNENNKIWFNVVYPGQLELDDLHSVLKIDEELLKNKNIKDMLVVNSSYVFFVVGYLRNESSIVSIKCFVFNNIAITISNGIFEFQKNAIRDVMRFKPYDDFVYKFFYAMLNVLSEQYISIFDDIRDALEVLEKKIENDNLKNVIMDLKVQKKKYAFIDDIVERYRNCYKITRFDIMPVEKADKIFGQIYDDMDFFANRLDRIRDTIKDVQYAYGVKMQERMGVILYLLTLVSFVFTPITFITGVYNMQVKGLPYKDVEDGFFILTRFMGYIFVVCCAISYAFWRKVIKK